ncbi:MAG: hypothetical protein AAF664_06145, partial [Planctomycetota bacterium]
MTSVKSVISRGAMAPGCGSEPDAMALRLIKSTGHWRLPLHPNPRIKVWQIAWDNRLLSALAFGLALRARLSAASAADLYWRVP